MGWHLEISGMCIMLNITIKLFIKDIMNFKKYFKFEGSANPKNYIKNQFQNSILNEKNKNKKEKAN